MAVSSDIGEMLAGIGLSMNAFSCPNMFTSAREMREAGP